MYLVRKISRAKWDLSRNSVLELSGDEISADAVTADLRTKENKLSFWQCKSSSVEDVENVVLAIESASDSLERVDIVWLSIDELESDGQSLRSSEGRTALTEFINEHVDVCRLDLVRLGLLAKRVMNAIRGGNCRSIAKSRLKEIIASAIDDERIDRAKIDPKLEKDVRE